MKVLTLCDYFACRWTSSSWRLLLPRLANRLKSSCQNKISKRIWSTSFSRREILPQMSRSDDLLLPLHPSPMFTSSDTRTEVKTEGKLEDTLPHQEGPNMELQLSKNFEEYWLPPFSDLYLSCFVETNLVFTT